MGRDRADFDRAMGEIKESLSAQAVAMEVRKEEGRGILCTALILQGSLQIGDAFVIGFRQGV